VARTLEAKVEQVGRTTGKGSVRQHTIFIDRPVDKGGEDRGPMGGELLLLSLGGCFLSNLLAAVGTRSAEVSNVRIAVTATIGGVPERVEAMTMHVAASYTDSALMGKLVAIAERGCLVTQTLKNAMVITIVLENSSQ
jgi:putative redox protein